MYTWKGMTKVTTDEAIKRFSENKEVYLLYDDETEGLASSLQDLESHHKTSGEFGFENDLDTNCFDVSCSYCGRLVSLEPSGKANKVDLTNWHCEHC